MIYYEYLGDIKFNTICVNLIILNLISKFAHVDYHTICISHKADADGIGAATLIKKIFDAKPILIDTSDFIKTLEIISNTEKLKNLYICDFGIDDKDVPQFNEIINDLVAKNVLVTYIDHHDTNPEIIKKLKNKINVIYDSSECATVLVYNEFREKLSYDAQFLAACAAITDYTDSAPECSKIVHAFDRQFVFANATMLTYYISDNQKNDDILEKLIMELANSNLPCEITGLCESAKYAMSKIAQLIPYVYKNKIILNNLAHLEIKGPGRPRDAAHFVHGLSGKNVGIAYKKRRNNEYGISIKGSGNNPHLGKLANTLAPKFDGSGNGHKNACNCNIPASKMISFIHEFDKHVGLFPDNN